MAKLIENLQFRFSNESTGRDSRICRSRYSQAAMANCQPRIVNAHRNVKQACRPKLPVHPATNPCRQLQPAAMTPAGLRCKRVRAAGVNAPGYSNEGNLPENKKTSGEKKCGENNRGDFTLEKRQPNQRLRPEQLCDGEDSSDP